MTAKEYPGKNYDLVTIFDALHDMGDPVGAAIHIANTLADGGTLMLVEPFAGDSLEENLHPLGQIYYSFSTMVCVPASKSQEVGLGPWCAGRAKTAHRSAQRCRFQPSQACRRNTHQSDTGS